MAFPTSNLRLSTVLSTYGYGTTGSMSSLRGKNYSDVTKWHPYENYKNLYACRKDLGGGVILTECHEIQ